MNLFTIEKVETPRVWAANSDSQDGGGQRKPTVAPDGARKPKPEVPPSVGPGAPVSDYGRDALPRATGVLTTAGSGFPA
jgi:hypothetical protein